MTDQELARALFQQRPTSMASASLLIGRVMSVEADGSVIVDVGGATIGDPGAGVAMSTTVACADGDTVVITLYGRDGRGKKGIVTGVVM